MQMNAGVCEGHVHAQVLGKKHTSALWCSVYECDRAWNTCIHITLLTRCSNNLSTCMHMYAYLCVCTSICMSMCMHVYVHAHLCVCISMCMHIYVHNHMYWYLWCMQICIAYFDHTTHTCRGMSDLLVWPQAEITALRAAFHTRWRATSVLSM
jgi:hypothetical protein